MIKREIILPDKIDEMALAQARAAGIDISAFYAGLLSDHLLNGEPAKLETLGSEPGPGELQHPESREVGGFIRDPNNSDRCDDKCDYGYFEYVGSGKGDHVLTDDTGENPDSSPPTAGTFEKTGPGQGDYVMTAGFGFSPRPSLDVAKWFPGFPLRSIRYAQRVVDEATGIQGVVASEYKQKNGRKIGIAFKPNFLMIEALLQRKSGIRVSLYGEPDRFKDKPSSLGRGRGRYSRIVVKTDEDLKKLLLLVREAYVLKLGPVPAPDDEDFI
ncbi:MAG: hypothetical protein WCE23_15865 [Candidatus Binatus sp.]|uniref:hypothetical protein n=1 Tax=Candidatus Binatus sp. TaxID=2811406 RepID=UPI003C74DA6B